MSTPDTPTDPEQLRAEIAETRAELGATVEALAAKVDVKTRAKNTITDATSRARQKLSTTKAQTVQAVGSARQKLTDPSGPAATKIAPARRQAVALEARVVAVRRHPRVQRSLPPLALVTAAAVVAGAVWVVIRRRRS